MLDSTVLALFVFSALGSVVAVLVCALYVRHRTARFKKALIDFAKERLGRDCDIWLSDFYWIGRRAGIEFTIEETAHFEQGASTNGAGHTDCLYCESSHSVG